MKDLQDIVHDLKSRNISLKATEQSIDTSTAAGKCFLDMLGVFAEFETNLRRERQLEGIAAAKAEGVYKGRVPKNPIDASTVVRLRSEGVGVSKISRRLSTGPASRLIARSFAIVFGAHSAFAESNDIADTYRLPALFGDVFERLRFEYVDPVNDRNLIEDAINGMLSGLDPHSGYLSAQAFREMEEQTKGEFAGLGIQVSVDGGHIRVVNLLSATPASRAGIKVGDTITALDGTAVQGLSLDDLLNHMKGAPNSKITLTIKRAGTDEPLLIPMRRAIIRVEVVKRRLERDGIGYVRLTVLTEKADAGLKQAVESLRQQANGRLRALILDLRNNPGGLLDQAVAISSDFIEKGEIVSVRARSPDDAQRWDSREYTGCADQRRLSLLQRNRRRCIAGSPPCRACRDA
jgi:C-terminal peptidase prc